MNILFVVHRYAPLPGGSEYNTQAMAEAAAQIGHSSYVLTGQAARLGEQNGVFVSGNPQILMEPFDLIVIHGSCPMQDIALANAHLIKAPKLYLLIGPPRGAENMDIIRNGLKHCQWVGKGTSFDQEFFEAENVSPEKIVPIRYGILPEYAQGNEGFKKANNIETERMFVAAGGFYPHKRLKELANTFKKVSPPDTTLALFGYESSEHGLIPEETDNVRVFTGRSRYEVVDAISEADLLLLNSREEGYGIVLLEAMFNRTQWAAKPVGVAPDIERYGTIYNTDEELEELLSSFSPNEAKISQAYVYVNENHIATRSTINDITIVTERL